MIMEALLSNKVPMGELLRAADASKVPLLADDRLDNEYFALRRHLHFREGESRPALVR